MYGAPATSGGYGQRQTQGQPQAPPQYGTSNGQAVTGQTVVTGVPVGYPTQQQPTYGPYGQSSQSTVIALGPDGNPLPEGTVFIGPDGREYKVGPGGAPEPHVRRAMVCGCGLGWTFFILGIFFPLAFFIGSFSHGENSASDLLLWASPVWNGFVLQRRASRPLLTALLRLEVHLCAVCGSHLGPQKLSFGRRSFVSISIHPCPLLVSTSIHSCPLLVSISIHPSSSSLHSTLLHSAPSSPMPPSTCATPLPLHSFPSSSTRSVHS